MDILQSQALGLSHSANYMLDPIYVWLELFKQISQVSCLKATLSSTPPPLPPKKPFNKLTYISCQGSVIKLPPLLSCSSPTQIPM